MNCEAFDYFEKSDDAQLGLFLDANCGLTQSKPRPPNWPRRWQTKYKSRPSNLTKAVTVAKYIVTTFDNGI